MIKLRNWILSNIIDYRWNLFIRFAIETYISVVVSCLITIYNVTLPQTNLSIDGHE